MLDEHEVLFYVLKAISVSCENKRNCRDCPFLSADTHFCIFQDTSPAYWNMEELQHNILGGDNIYYMVGIDGDYAGNYTRKQLKQFNDLYVISIWTLNDRPGAVCLDLITEDKWR